MNAKFSYTYRKNLGNAEIISIDDNVEGESTDVGEGSSLFALREISFAGGGRDGSDEAVIPCILGDSACPDIDEVAAKHGGNKNYIDTSSKPVASFTGWAVPVSSFLVMFPFLSTHTHIYQYTTDWKALFPKIEIETAIGLF